MMTRACHFFLGGVPFSPVIVESRADLIILNHYGFFIVSHFSALRVVQYDFFESTSISIFSRLSFANKLGGNTVYNKVI